MVMPGGTCDLAIAATEGDDGNEATGDEQWFMYTTTLRYANCYNMLSWSNRRYEMLMYTLVVMQQAH